MRYRLAPSDILAAWETGAARRPLDRAMAVLWAAGATDHQHPADLPLAERDRRLLLVRADTFGPVLPARATCPNCGAELEMELDAGQLAETLPVPDGRNPLRPLTSRDLAAVAELAPDDLTAALRARLAGAGGDVAELDREIEDQARAVELSTEVTCTECGTVWTETLDVGAFVWAEVEIAALGLLSEVAEIAAVYGWSEAAVLALSPARRQAYLAWARQP